MKIHFVYNPELEWERILVRFHYLTTGLYQEQGFLVLPYRLPYVYKSVYLPEIPNFNPKNYLPELRRINPSQVPLEKTPEVIKVLSALKATNFKLEKIDVKRAKKVENEWLLIQPQFEDYFLEIFPQYRQYQINLEIYWTRYGTSVSFDTARIRNKVSHSRIFLRDDMGISQIAEGFLSSFFSFFFNKEKNNSWLLREAIIDFLLQNTKLNRLFPDYLPTLASFRKTKDLQKYYLDSINYLNKLGFNIKPVLSVYKNKILINGQLPKFRFSPTEEEILKKLVVTPNQVVSYYDLGDLIWKDDADRFSLWALSRLIFKIRNKLRKNGLSPEHIKNFRGKGYYYTSQP